MYGYNEVLELSNQLTQVFAAERLSTRTENSFCKWKKRYFYRLNLYLSVEVINPNWTNSVDTSNKPYSTEMLRQSEYLPH